MPKQGFLRMETDRRNVPGLHTCSVVSGGLHASYFSAAIHLLPRVVRRSESEENKESTRKRTLLRA